MLLVGSFVDTTGTPWIQRYLNEIVGCVLDVPAFGFGPRCFIVSKTRFDPVLRTGYCEFDLIDITGHADLVVDEMQFNSPFGARSVLKRVYDLTTLEHLVFTDGGDDN